MERVKSKLGRANREHPAYHLHTIYQHLSPKLQPGEFRTIHYCYPFQNILQIEVEVTFFNMQIWLWQIPGLLLFSCPIVFESLWPHGLQHARPPCPSPSPRVCPSSCPLNWWYHPTISSSAALFSFCLQSFPASGSFPMSWLFTSGGQSIGASASA